ncbi:MAG: hypothetical protein AB7E81_21355 [Hyphomicrobiaceae bacterium]
MQGETQLRELTVAEVQNVSGGADCTYNSLFYSKGSVVKMDDGKNYVCTGDKQGTWKSQ